MANSIKQQVLDAFQFRHACKAFDPNKKINDEDFQYIIETGRLSPSSFGFEPWKFVILQNQKLREKLSEVAWGAQTKLSNASHFVLILQRTQQQMRYDSDYISYMIRDVKQFPEDMVAGFLNTFKNFQEKEFHLLDTERGIADWAGKQTYIPLANMMTSAAMIGIDSCPIEGFNRDKVNELLAAEGIINDEFEISVMVAFGYRNQEPRPKTRQALQQVVEWVR
ncbi:Nitroreductase [Seinonella peptonophila]|uniref:Nitroreductase n=1 Tax=Seinonella peptonophila TaxID=112248 RepID=A0A1M4ZAE1_9BACL|nr:NAD(P)H-dependent oxidoreductase [Seinonella peptonophila]SHF15010.1 Nitroreductase [Seinonella peptonophila]